LMSNWLYTPVWERIGIDGQAKRLPESITPPDTNSPSE
jgi:hypothetical protein